MAHTVLTLLCKEVWARDSSTHYDISFKLDGTGELIAYCCDGGGPGVYISAEIEWEATNPSILNKIVNITPGGRNAQVLVEFEIKMTLTKRRAGLFREPRSPQDYKLNQAYLLDDAFLPKKYKIRLEKGNFISSKERKPDGTISPPWASAYTLRLVFDKSPYPPAQLWKDPDDWDHAMMGEEWKEFHSGKADGWGMAENAMQVYYSIRAGFWGLVSRGD
ncbi:hypothetical protein MGYG_06681 [Nannizzia gypsea CBS 118893]|uniref:Uncharacterized protein n=1 Tax=Arthroderma gypseum (strain ATCC MYA-4604 / CBS 118893) TaxID=535722 RepID=E4V0W9_ARTGP|nr:hypothetical protein MGYG_06681 [Nannizzia gypsea CBS 118893]EFR03684.1 hypothetical protein MGYG_06681 [Nannizzia gypsea CBS 118893]